MNRRKLVESGTVTMLDATHSIGDLDMKVSAVTMSQLTRTRNSIAVKVRSQTSRVRPKQVTYFNSTTTQFDLKGKDRTKQIKEISGSTEHHTVTIRRKK